MLVFLQADVLLGLTSTMVVVVSMVMTMSAVVVVAEATRTKTMVIAVVTTMAVMRMLMLMLLPASFSNICFRLCLLFSLTLRWNVSTLQRNRKHL